MPWIVSNAYVSEIPKIATLPRELVDEILCLLSPSEWKALRLTCRILEDFAVRMLFRRIQLSALNSHHDAFFNIGKSSRLSQLPEQLVWYEGYIHILQEWQEWAKQPETWEWPLTDFERMWYSELSEGIQDYMWIPSPRLIDQSTLELQLTEVPELLLQRFSIAFESMPNLRTFISTKWPVDFVWSRTGYNFTTNAVPVTYPHSGLGNVGLALALKHISTEALSKIQHLCWADLQCRSSCEYLGRDIEKAFKNLISIDLCLSSLRDDQDMPNLCSALRIATRLEHLKLCFEQHMDQYCILGRLLRHEASDKTRQPIWSRLSSLTLVEARFWEYDIFKFLVHHADSLRHLRLERCHLYEDAVQDVMQAEAETGSWKDLIKALAMSKNLNLHSLEISQDEDVADVDPVSEDVLLKFINDGGPSPFLADLSYKYINTHDLDLEDKDFYQAEELCWWGHQADLEDCELIAKSYWTLRRVQNHIVWWDIDHPREGHYKTELWLFEHKSGSFAYGKDPWEYFDDWESYEPSVPCECDDGPNEECEWHPEHGQPVEVMVRAENTVTESPFGPSFDAFCRKEDSEPVIPSDVQYPSHAMILLDDGVVIPWQQFKDSYVRSWQLVKDLPVRMRAE